LIDTKKDFIFFGGNICTIIKQDLKRRQIIRNYLFFLLNGIHNGQ
jgi:hypothetical protein